MSEAIELGWYLPGEAEGAYPNGTRIVKVKKEAGDLTPIGGKGVVMASHDASMISIPGLPKADYFYFVKWDDFEHPVGVCDWKIGEDRA